MEVRTIAENSSSSSSSQVRQSISMFDWQYDLQKKLQNPRVINYSEQEHGEKAKDALSESKEKQERGEDFSLRTDKTLATNITTTTSSHTSDSDKNNMDASVAKSANASKNISIVPGSGSPNSGLFYEPSPAKVVVGSTLTWTNDDTLPHTVTSGNPEKGPNSIFDSGIMSTDKSFTYTFDKVGVLEYYCAIHPWMIGKVMVQ